VALQYQGLSHLHDRVAGLTPADAHLFVWWLRWTPWALVHGHDPLVTDYLNYPDGVNAMWNTSVPLLGLLALPITLTTGPVVAFNLMMLLGPAVSGLAFVLVARRYLRRPWAAGVGGLVYAFSPFAVAHAQASHLNLVWNVFPPLLVLLLDEILVRQRLTVWRAGLLLGLTLVVQTGIYVQTIATGVVVSVIAVVLLALRWPRRTRHQWRYAARSVAVGAAVYLVICAYPLYVLLAGPARPSGRIRATFVHSTDLARLVVPSRSLSLRPGTDGLAGHLSRGLAEQGGYLGVVVILVLVLTAALVRRPLVRMTASTGAVALVLSLGPHLVLLGKTTSVPLPWLPLSTTAILKDIEPARFGVYVACSVALLVACWLEWAVSRETRPRRCAALTLGVVGVVSLTPTALETTPAVVPPFFGNGAVKAYVSQGQVLKTVSQANPDAYTGYGDPMLWQAVAGFRYRSTGGYFIGSSTAFPVIQQSPPDGYDDVAISILRGGLPPAPGSAASATARQALTTRKVAALVVVPQAGRPDTMLIAWTEALTHTPATWTGGVWILRLR
jgi:hypothetical protein